MVEKNEEIASGQFGYVYKGTKAKCINFGHLKYWEIAKIHGLSSFSRYNEKHKLETCFI